MILLWKQGLGLWAALLKECDGIAGQHDPIEAARFCSAEHALREAIGAPMASRIYAPCIAAAFARL